MSLQQSLLEILKNTATFDKDSNKYVFNSDALKNIVASEPKKPKNPFFLFKEENKDKIKKSMGSNSDFSGQGSFSSAASDIWKNMSLEEKMPYEEKYSKLKEEFTERKKVYDETFGRFNLKSVEEKPKKKRGRPRKSEKVEKVSSSDGYSSVNIDGVVYEIELETDVIWTEDREDAVGQRVGPNKYEFY